MTIIMYSTISKHRKAIVFNSTGCAPVHLVKVVSLSFSAQMRYINLWFEYTNAMCAFFETAANKHLRHTLHSTHANICEKGNYITRLLWWVCCRHIVKWHFIHCFFSVFRICSQSLRWHCRQSFFSHMLNIDSYIQYPNNRMSSVKWFSHKDINRV